MRTLHVLDRSYPTVAGYTSRARAILRGQRALGMDPEVVTSPRQASTASREEIDGVTHHRTRLWGPLAQARSLPLIREALEATTLSRRVEEIARARRPAVVHAHSPVLCGAAAHAAARRLGVPSVYEIRALWEDAIVNQGRTAEWSPRYLAMRRAETSLARSVDALVVLCGGLRRDLLGRGLAGDHIYTVPNGVDTERFAPRARDEALARSLGLSGSKVVGYVGTFFRFEGLALLVETMARVIARDDSVRGLIVGHGESERELSAQVDRLGLKGKVVLAGPAAPEDVTRYYSVIDVLCYPRESHRITELTTPLKPLEAMSMGKAILTSDVGGLRELVREDETALCFRASEGASLERMLALLLGDEPLRRRLGEEARREMVQNRSWASIAKRYVDVYAAAAERARARAPRRLAAPAYGSPSLR